MSYGNLFNKTQAAENVANKNSTTFTQPVKSLPILKDAEGNTYAMELSEIQNFGIVKNSKQSEINNQILSKTLVADSGVMAQGFTQIMALSEKVDIGSLADSKVGFLKSLRNKFIDRKAEVKAQFTTVRKQITDVAANLKTKLIEMEEEGKWLESMYKANLEEVRMWEQNKILVNDALEQAESYLQNLINTDASVDQIEETRMKVNALSKQADKVNKMHQLSAIAAPEIRMMQVTNFNNVNKFNDILELTIPYWEKKMSLALNAENQRQQIAQAKVMDDFTNNLIQETAKQVGQNMVDSAKANQRGIADVDIMVEATNVIINSIKEVVEIDKNGNNVRKENAKKIEKSLVDMQDALRSV
ncbi:TPA: hypothetical protein MA058_003377 [Klebsiella pneumoniae]|nr:hypothetical protein [Klebsiella pneumoniae]